MMAILQAHHATAAHVFGVDDLKPSASSGGSTVSIGTYSEQFGLYSTGVRILAAVLGIIIALYFNSAALLAVMLVMRVFVEIGDVIVGLVLNQGTPDTNTFTLLALAAVEIIMIALLMKTLKKALAHS